MSEDRTQNLPGGDLGEVLSLLRSIDARLTNVENRLSSVENRLSALEEKVDALEEKVDRRLQETRPIWEQVLVRLTNVEQELLGVREGLVKVETRLGKVEDEVYDLGRKFRIFNKDILKLQDKQADMEERLDRTDSEHVK
jgi:chromosome segregation ATPase